MEREVGINKSRFVRSEDMLIVAKQDDIDDLYAIWDTVTDRFIGVNLGKYEAVGLIMDYKGADKCNFEQALSRVEHQQPFIDIAKQITTELYNVSDMEHWLNREIERAKISVDEYAECFDGVKVDNKTRKELLKGHIRFCENALRILKD